MSADRAEADLLTLPRVESQVNEGEYLSTLSPKDKPWDRHRAEADEVQEVYAESTISRHHRYADRVEHCSQVLEFARDPPKKKIPGKLKLKGAWFCRVRFCPVCQWRRSLKYQALVYQALPRMMKDYPNVRFLFMTLTVRNCEVRNLRQTLDLMCKAWWRLTHLRAWPAMGWVRSVEITRGKDGSAHPHYHCLLMVRPMYFQGDYLQQRQWAELWQRCLRINYWPIVDVRVVKPDHGVHTVKIPAKCQIWGAVVEILKYQVKVSDMIRDHDWFLAMTDQVWKTKAVIVGGVFRHYIRERKQDDLTQEPGEAPPVEELERLFFGWKHDVRRYRRVGK